MQRDSVMSQQAILEPDNRRLRYIEVDPDLILSLLKIPPGGLRVGEVIIQSAFDSILQKARCLRAKKEVM